MESTGLAQKKNQILNIKNNPTKTDIQSNLNSQNIIGKIFNTKETINLAKEFQNIIGAELAFIIAIPNIILTLAGLKGTADLHWIQLSEEAFHKLKEKTKLFQHLGLDLNFDDNTGKNNIIGNLLLSNIQGIERKTTTSQLPYIPRYNSSSSINGLKQGYKILFKNIQEAKLQGILHKKTDTDILIVWYRTMIPGSSNNGFGTKL